ncbi:MAG: hypothetical protein ACQERM_02840 [Methanobacteriota archaeon]
MWSPKELTAAFKVVAYQQIRDWLRLLKFGAYIVIWITSFVLVGTPIETALGENHQGGLLVGVLAATAVFALVIYLKRIVLMRVD